jgi:sigma-54-interacting transcriptional regulator
MENPSTALAGATAHEDLLLMGMPPVNLLLTGSHGRIREVLGRLLRAVDGPIAAWYPGERLVLPGDPRTGTLILHELGFLGYAEQIRLLEWLEEGVGRTQVVSTTSTSLLPRVQAGTFNDVLYYRLNTVSVDVTR